MASYKEVIMTNEAQSGKRIAALDITRGIAVLGMIYMNFRIVLAGDFYDESYSFLTSQEGRFGVLFIFLAGIGVSLMTSRALANDDLMLLKKNRLVLAKRALFLFVIGMIFSLYWFADILHFYSFYLIAAIPLLRLRRKTLWLISPIPVLIALVLNLFLNWETGWNFDLFIYRDFYNPAGFLRNLFFNGFHPFFPWFSFFILGMAAGRKIPDPGRYSLLKLALSSTLLIVCEVLSSVLQSGIGSDLYSLLFSTRAFPPAPLFVISASAQSFAIFYLVIQLTGLLKSNSLVVEALSATGRMVMTHYVLHLIIGLIPLMIASATVNTGPYFILIYSIAYFLFTLAVTTLWNQKFPHGPLEGLMRRFS